LTMLFFFFIVASLDQPLLELHLTVEGLTIHAKQMTLRDLLIVAWNADTGLNSLGFVLLVFVIPVLYCTMLLASGISDMSCWKSCLHEPPARVSEGALWAALLLRPWVMTDVFAIALGLFLFSMQDKFVVTTIPDGILQWPSFIPFPGDVRPDPVRVHVFSGIYLLMGAGLTIFYLRWFWSVDQILGAYEAMIPREDSREMSRENSREDRRDSEVHNRGYTDFSADGGRMKRMSTTGSSSKAEACYRNLPFANWKACWCILVWIGACAGLHCIPLPMQKFRLEHTNAVLNGTLPIVNEMISAELPASFGSCDSTDSVPQPCQEKGPLYHAMQGKNRISILYVTGLDTLSLTKLALEVHAVEKDPTSQDDALGWSHVRDHARNPNAKPALDRILSSAAVVADQSPKDIETMQAKLASLKAKEASMQKQIDGAKSTTVPLTTTIVKTDSLTTAIVKTAIVTTTAAPALTTTPALVLGPGPAAAQTTTTKIPHGSQKYKLGVSGEFRHMGLYLKVEMCDDDQGNGCKPFLATNSSCCDDHRSFHIEISFKCDRDGNPLVHVSDFQLGSLVIDAHANVPMKRAQQQLIVTLPSQDITGKVKDTVKAKLTHFLTKKKLIKWGSKQLDFQQLLGRVLKFSAHDDLFRC